MPLFESGLLGRFNSAEKRQLYRFSFPYGLGYDPSRPQYHQSVTIEYISTVHSLPTNYTGISNMGLDCRGACQEESFRAQIQEHSRGGPSEAQDQESKQFETGFLNLRDGQPLQTRSRRYSCQG